jgi:diphthamide synthase (EF-2-diphthine--ammonia ligase)
LLLLPFSGNGDLHLEHIRKWREDHIGPIAAELGMTLHSPLWRVSYVDLMADLVASKTPCRVCALGDPPQGRSAIPKIGDLFDQGLINSLDAEYDAFGENGEFHSIAEVWDGPTHPLTAA